ncbi:MAG: sulfite exporter TauE/SafE family protein [Bacteroidales bacterium]|nr:sulfite exporter TauE/SafE family protein [Bacteroidales bacterium]
MEFLYSILDNTNTPFITAFILGLMTAISPCPLATNITATAFISKDLENKKRIFYNGLFYTMGRAISYTAIGIILFFGASTFQIGGFFQKYGERFLGPLLIIIGIFMLDIIPVKFSFGNGKWQDKLSGSKSKGSWWNAVLLGMIFALAFCPYSGVLYFGMLIPITIASPDGLWLPLVFAFATGLPVIIIAWLLAFGIAKLGNFYNKLKTFEYWFRKIVAIIFILVGIYYVIMFLMS